MKKLLLLTLLVACSSAPPRPAAVEKPAPPPAPPIEKPAEAPDDGSPKPMARDAFKGLVRQVDMQAGDVAKMALLKTALTYNYLTSAMAGVLLEHIVYRQSKLDALPMLRDRILDKENMYLLIDHFTYREDKAKVQEMLSQ